MTREEAKQHLRARKWLMQMDRHQFCEKPDCAPCETAARYLVGFHKAEKERNEQ